MSSTLTFVWKNKWFQRAMLLSFALLLFSFAHIRQEQRVCKHIKIEVMNPEAGAFIDSAYIAQLLYNPLNGERDNLYNSQSEEEKLPDGRVYGGVLKNYAQKEINLRKVEKFLSKNPYIHKAQVVALLNGDVSLRLWEPLTMVRFISKMSDDYYMDVTGRLYKECPRYTARVITVEGLKTDAFGDNKYFAKNGSGFALYGFLKFIYEDAFWSTMISSINIQPDGSIILLPAIGNQMIEFGTIENFPNKFSRLISFYKDIVPKKGWNTYKKVSVKFDNQIICS